MRTLQILFLLLSTAMISKAAAAPAASQLGGLAKVERQRASFTSGGKRIGVEIFAPAGANRLPAVIVLHSAAGTLVGKGQMERIARGIASRGMAAFLVRYFDRTGTIFANDRDIDALSGVWLQTVQDAVNFVAAHPRADARAIGMFGYSLGAFLAVAESSRDPRIDAVAEAAGGIFRGFEPKMRRMPALLILHGRMDQRVPVRRAFELEAAARRLGRKPTVRIYEGHGHLLRGAAAEDATARAIDFLNRSLQVAIQKGSRSL